MEEALLAYLRAYAEVSALVGALVNWDERPQGSGLPSVVLYEVSGTPSYTMSGRVGLTPYVIQIDCLALKGNAAKALRLAVIHALDALNASPTQTLRFAEITGTRSDRDTSGTTPISRASLDVRVWTTTA